MNRSSSPGPFACDPGIPPVVAVGLLAGALLAGISFIALFPFRQEAWGPPRHG